MTGATSHAPIQVVVLPGWLNSEPAHWQSHWIKQHGATRIEQHDWVSPLRGDWVAALESQFSDCRDAAE
ncbi:MAG: alpha/beta hydrolase, partial [Burkholderiaceae bacterium]|nr:alpha/beta hydrolase [Burkholderiaceae bacterium]